MSLSRPIQALVAIRHRGASTEDREVNHVDRRRGLRGLAIAGHYYQKEEEAIHDRGIITVAWKARGRRTGCCRWCGERVEEGSRRHWHSACVLSYTVATGAVAMLGNEKVIDTSKCCVCGRKENIEIDHVVPLGLARARGRRAYIRAHSIDNLQALCRECHAGKSQRDYWTIKEAADEMYGQMKLF